MYMHIFLHTQPFAQLLGPDTHSYTLREGEADFSYIPNFVAEACDAIDGITYHCYINTNKSALLTPDGLDEQYRESVRVSDIFNNGSLCDKPGVAGNIIAGEIAEHNSPRWNRRLGTRDSPSRVRTPGLRRRSWRRCTGIRTHAGLSHILPIALRRGVIWPNLPRTNLCAKSHTVVRLLWRARHF